MKKGKSTLNIVLLSLFSLGLMACGGGSSSSSKGGSNVNNINGVVPIQRFIEDNGVLNPNPTPGSSITIALNNLPTSLSSLYPGGIDMELDIGTVIGEHMALDSHQAGDITFHRKLGNGQTSFSFYTSGGNTLDDVSENFWSFNNRGDLVWRGVFEGPNGAIVIVVDGIFNSGDGSDPFDFMSGSVWFKPWQVVGDTGINSQRCVVKNGRLDCKNPSGPLTRCWDVSLGPYDCRFNVSADSQNVTAVGNEFNQEQYTKIGEFIDLSRERTFKETY
jgi:hypothetical protein